MGDFITYEKIPERAVPIAVATKQQGRERIKEFSSDEERLDRIARMGAEKARESAAKTLNEVRKIIGFRQY